MIPAPQTFLKTQRPEKLETTSEAKVVGVHSGNASENIHHVAHALHRGDKLKPNVVQCVRVEEDHDKERPSTKRYGPLAILAVIGFIFSATLLGLCFRYNDGYVCTFLTRNKALLTALLGWAS